VPASLLPVGHNIDPGLLLVGQSEARGIVLRLPEAIGRHHPRGEKLKAGVREPRGLGQASRDRRPEHG